MNKDPKGLIKSPLVRDKLVSIIQDPQFVEKVYAGQVKGVQICVQVVGDSAIKEAMAPNVDALSAMMKLLKKLPQPRLVWIKALAMLAALEVCDNEKTDAADYLGVSFRSYCRDASNNQKWPNMIEAIKNGQIEFKPEAEDTPELSWET